jgi:hypothetical protein
MAAADDYEQALQTDRPPDLTNWMSLSGHAPREDLNTPMARAEVADDITSNAEGMPDHLAQGRLISADGPRPVSLMFNARSTV